MGDILREITREPWPVVLEWLKARPALPQRAMEGPKRATRVSSPKGLEPLIRRHRKKLRQDGFDPEELERLWQLQSITGKGNPLAERLFIPCFCEGVLCSWTTRAMFDTHHGNRYRAACPQQETIARQNRLYGQDYVRNSVIVCEGPRDVWAIGPGAVATLSLGCSDWQLAWLSRIPIRVICFDAEPIATKRAIEVVDALSMFPGITSLLELETGNDPAEADEEELEEIRQTFFRGMSS